MEISINHETIYQYEAPVHYTIQSLRLTPQPFDGQVVRDWSVKNQGPGKLHSFEDSFGNLTHTLVINEVHEEIRLLVKGRVLVEDTNGVVTGTNEPFPPIFYLRETSQTEPNKAIVSLAKEAAVTSKDRLDKMYGLMNLVRDAIEYETGQTEALTTAVEALANGKGVCQDHAHVFIAAARSLGVPARYVSGYLLHSEDGEESEASHAWAEAHIEGLGWVAFDVANRVSTTDQYVRIGVGLDYSEASPVRGIRRGGGAEALRVNVLVERYGEAAQ